MAPRSKVTALWVTVASLGTLCAIGLVAFGAVAGLAGILDQTAADRVYHVQFGHPGAGCDSKNTIGFDIDDGQALLCSASPNTIGQTHGYGFSAAQNAEITDLATQLGTDGLSPADQQQVQQRVDQIVADLPHTRRPGHGALFWGARQAWISCGLVLGSLLSLVLLWWALLRSAARGNHLR
ncbi:hypothetical protein Caci_7161 [Catenulispora acidiphila DSM 44928]|uniref:Uncharacterized protein n=1 Tax=Catenulispora acidiphila (strain DSM 44928 / JCM 14897 / NBRC 102108 / NRRL B-24433 / ID139908) TaxID=479433 RepID=C7Q6X7_CATAD|nr:hypothetical protein [Catenulispora acidiphila]ACU75990.1 hypothetical protein Caci_7161 [Catenulispora acidiphila DSM 44928]